MTPTATPAWCDCCGIERADGTDAWCPASGSDPQVHRFTLTTEPTNN